jgi:hypothetical protein
MTAVLETAALSKKYGRRWALRLASRGGESDWQASADGRVHRHRQRREGRTQL